MKKKISLLLVVMMVVLTVITAVPTAAEEAAALADTGADVSALSDSGELPAPTVTKIENRTDGIYLEWTNVGAYQYDVEIMSKSGDVTIITTKCNLLYSDVKVGETYTFMIIGLDKDGMMVTDFDVDGTSITYNTTTQPTQKPTQAPTQKPTQAPTQKPTQAPTVKPTAAPTVKPTAAPTTAPTEPPLPLGESAAYTSGDTDFDGEITVMDATMIQYVLANMWDDKNGAIAKVGNVNTADDFNVTDATYIQRKVAQNSIPSSVKVGTKAVSMALPESKTYSAPFVSTSQTNDGVKVSWRYVYYAPMYRVFKKVGNTWNHLGDTSELSFVDKTASKVGTYTYAVRVVNADHQQHLSPFSATSTFTINSTTVNYITPSVYVYDGHFHVSWDKFTGADKYVVSLYLKSNGPDSIIEKKTVTDTSVVLERDFTPPKGKRGSYKGKTYCTTVTAYKGNTALTTPKPVDTTTAGKYLKISETLKYRSVWYATNAVNFCNYCGTWLPYDVHYDNMGRISPENADVSHQRYHAVYDGCPATTYRCWDESYPSGLNDVYYSPQESAFHWSVVDTNFAEDYFPVISTAPSISSIKKIAYKKEIHPEQRNNLLPQSEKTDKLPWYQAEDALEITFKPTDPNIDTYYIWVKSKNAKSVSKLTSVDRDRWTYDESIDTEDWSVVGLLRLTGGKCSSYFYSGNGSAAASLSTETKTNDFSTLKFILPNYYGNEYNSMWDWTMLDNNATYEFAIQPRYERGYEPFSTTVGRSVIFSVPAAPRGQSKSFTWTGRDYEYYTDNNAYFLGATLRTSNITSKVIELYAEQRNLTVYGDNPWGHFQLFALYTDKDGREILSLHRADLLNICCRNNYKIPIRTDEGHKGTTYTWRGYADHGVDVLSTRGAVFRDACDHTDGVKQTMTIASHGLYAQTSLEEIWNKRNDYGKRITLTDNDVPYYDPICYEYGLDGSYTYYYEDVSSLASHVPAGYVPCTPDPNAVRKENNEHLWERYVDPYLRRQYATGWSDYN